MTPDSNSAAVRTAGRTFELSSSDIDALAEELTVISHGSPSVSDAGELATRLTAGGHQPIDLDDHERFLLLRATHHLRHFGPTSHAITDLRDHLSATGEASWIAYKLAFVDGRPGKDFTSYSLKYEPQDRLVAPDGNRYRIVRVDDSTLVLDDWDAAR